MMSECFLCVVSRKIGGIEAMVERMQACFELRVRGSLCLPPLQMTPSKRQLATTRSFAGKDPQIQQSTFPNVFAFVFVCSTLARKDNLTVRFEAV